MSILTVENVSHAFFTKENCRIVLTDIYFQLKEGERVAFLGPSGCGKSTLLSVICGMLKPTQGTVYFDGVPVTAPDGQIGYMLQQDYLYPWLTVKENVILGLKIRKSFTQENRVYVEQFVD